MDISHPSPFQHELTANCRLAVEGGDDTRKYWLQGNKELLENPLRISIVGSREISDSDFSNIYRLVKKIIAWDGVIVSGLARGVDAAAHEYALGMGGKTIAVLGTSIDQFYPKENEYLQKQIAKKGLLLSQFELGEKIQSFNFPKRNETIVRTSEFCIITQATTKSGTRHIVDAAIKYKKNIFVLPVVENKKIFWINDKISNGTIEVLSSNRILENKIEQHYFSNSKNEKQQLSFDFLNRKNNN